MTEPNNCRHKWEMTHFDKHMPTFKCRDCPAEIMLGSITFFYKPDNEHYIDQRYSDMELKEVQHGN